MINILFTILTLCLIIIVIFWLLFYKAFSILSKGETPFDVEFPPVSVIVCYKNAKHHLLPTIQSILSQQYPLFEVIAIDDFSSDGSASVLDVINDSRLILLQADRDTLGKKSALTQAILHAKNELLLFTDADCLPTSPEWIKSMVTSMLHSNESEIVLGYGPMHKTIGWLNAFVRYETILTAIQYVSYTVFKIPYMGVGRNLMYKKSLFIRHNGFESHKNIASGDDDLMISKAATSKNTIVNLQPKSFVYSDGKHSLSSFLQQKSRHVTTSVHYNLLHQSLLTIFAFAQFGFYVTLLIMLVFGYISFVGFVFFLGLKWVFQMLFHQKAMQMLDGKDLVLLFPFLDVGIMVYYIVLPLYSVFRKKGW